MRRQTLTTLSLLILLSGCDHPEVPDSQASPPAPSAFSPEAVAPASHKAWAISRQQLQQTLQIARELQTGIQALLTEANDDTLNHARALWHRCHNQLMQALPLLALGDASPDLWRPLQETRRQLEAWPIEPGYLDYFDVYSHSGIVNDIAIPVNAQSLREQHGLTSDTDVSLGLHAMAYLLWGEQGQRPASDFQPQPLTDAQRRNGLQPVDLPSRRRATMLQLQATLLVDDLQQLVTRLTHGDLDSLHQKLPAVSNLTLWRESVSALLTPMTESPLATDTEAAHHNRFAGQRQQAEAAVLKGIEQLLFSHDEGVQPLAHWLVGDELRTPEQLAALQHSLAKAIEQLQAGGAAPESVQAALAPLQLAIASPSATPATSAATDAEHAGL